MTADPSIAKILRVGPVHATSLLDALCRNLTLCFKAVQIRCART